MGSRIVTTAAVIVVMIGTVAMDAIPAGAQAQDQYEAIAVSTTPADAVTVGQQFSLDAQWANLSGFQTPAFEVVIGVPNAVRIDGFTPVTPCSKGTDNGGQFVECLFPSGAPPFGEVTIHVDLTASTEVYGASFSAFAAIPEFSVVEDSTTLSIVPPGVTADVHPFAFTAPDALFVGQPATFTGQVANGGTVDMSDVTATVDLGSGLRLDGATWGVSRNPCTLSGTRAACSIGTLAARSAVPVELRVTPTAVTATSTTTLTVTTTSAEQQPDPLPDTVALTRSIQPTVSDLGVTVQFENAPVVGGSLFGEVVVTNHGPAPATNVKVVYTASDNYEVLDRFGCTTVENTFTCRFTDPFGVPSILAPGRSREVAFRLTPTNTEPGTVSARVMSSSTEPRPDPTANHMTAHVPAAAPASDDLQFVRWNQFTNPIVAGEATTSDLIFLNNGPSRSRGLRAVVTFPSTWTIESVQPNIFGTCTLAGSSATCDLDEIDGGQLSLIITATPSVGGADQVANATITTDYPDPDGPLHASVAYDVVDEPTLTVGGPVLVAEGDTAFLPLTLSLPSPKPVSVTCTTAGWTATAGADYVETTTTLSIPAGGTSATFTVQTLPDTLTEGTEAILVACGNVQNAHPADPDPTFGLMWSGILIV